MSNDSVKVKVTAETLAAELWEVSNQLSKAESRRKYMAKTYWIATVALGVLWCCSVLFNQVKKNQAEGAAALTGRPAVYQASSSSGLFALTVVFGVLAIANSKD